MYWFWFLWSQKLIKYKTKVLVVRRACYLADTFNPKATYIIYITLDCLPVAVWG